MKNDEKIQLQKLISNNKLQEAIDLVLIHAETTNDSSLRSSIIMQSSAYKKTKHEEINGTASWDELNIAYARIRAAVLNIIDEFPTEKEGFSNADNSKTLNSTNETSSKINQFSLISSLVLLLLILLITFLVPCQIGRASCRERV